MYYDIQKVFGILIGEYKNRKTLEHAVESLNIEKTIPFHRASSDTYYTTEVLKKIDFNVVKENYSIDYYYVPRSKEEELHLLFKSYYKYISREFETKELALRDREITATRCYICGKVGKKKIRWFSDNSKTYHSLSICEKHGFIKGKIRLKKSENDLYYVVKTLKIINDSDALSVKEKQDFIRTKRRRKRQKN